jgi:hypothetical protein
MTEGPQPPQGEPQPPHWGQPYPPPLGQPPPGYPPAYNYPASSLPQGKPWWTMWWVWTIAGSAVLVIILAIIGANSSTRSSTAGGSTPTSIPSTQDDWLAAVCKPGTFHNGGRKLLANADGQASCSSGLYNGQPIGLGQYSDEYMARNDVAMLRAASAIARTDSGDWEVFIALGDPSGRVLQPLADLGFTITPAERGRRR